MKKREGIGTVGSQLDYFKKLLKLEKSKSKLLFKEYKEAGKKWKKQIDVCNQIESDGTHPIKSRLYHLLDQNSIKIILEYTIEKFCVKHGKKFYTGSHCLSCLKHNDESKWTLIGNLVFNGRSYTAEKSDDFDLLQEWESWSTRSLWEKYSGILKLQKGTVISCQYKGTKIHPADDEYTKRSFFRLYEFRFKEHP